ncbi:MAG: agmatine deiminase family protein [Bacteroidales bacterium]|nr:agmatine deiminase family protein [Bacteroidales bacterium]
MLRLPAEWESFGAVLLSWPHKDSDWNYMLDEVTKCYINIVEAITTETNVIIIAPDIEIPQKQLSHINQSLISFYEIPTNDTWARDFGVITTCNDNGNFILNDFQFNGWGLKFASNKDNLITRYMIKQKAINGTYNNCMGFTLEGGSIESDGKGLLLTTSECLLSPNRNGDLSKEEIEQTLISTLGLKKILWLDHGFLEGDDTDSHIDTLARIAPNDTIVYVGTNDETDIHYSTLQSMKQQLMQFTTIEGNSFNLIELPLPDPIYDEDGNRLPATYANFLIMDKSVIMPIYAQHHKDLLATQIMQIAFPNHKIITVDCNALIKQHGSLHCVTMQLPKEIL